MGLSAKNLFVAICKLNIAMKKLLISFGCSWTAGVGVNYDSGMTFQEFKTNVKQQHILNRYSFRSLLCNDYEFHNVNFAKGGSSNQEQFRTAEDFFSSDDFRRLRDQYSDIVVLWGITSVFRNEAYFVDKKQTESYFYTNKSLLSKIIVANHFDTQHEVNLLSKKINFWNSLFDLLRIKNLWFDTFNHHDYHHNCIPEEIKQEYNEFAGESWPSWQQFECGDFSGVSPEVQQEILDKDRWKFYQHFGAGREKRLFKENHFPRDLMSQLAIQHGMPNVDDRYHLSDWEIDSDRVTFLIEQGILNPYSHHPTKQGHRCIADMLAPALGLI